MTKFVDAAAALVSKLTVCSTNDEVARLITDLPNSSGGIKVISFVNAHAVMRATRDASFLAALESSDLVFRDGVGMEMLMKNAGIAPGLNLNGTDLIPQILENTPRNTKLALCGTQEPRLGSAAKTLGEMGFNHVCTLDGFQDDAEYITFLAEQSPKIVVLAMGMPKQERVSKLICETPQLAARDMIVINGGAIVDFLSGDVTRAPRWMRQNGLEWAYRLLREPVRLFPRFRDSVMFTLYMRQQSSKLKNALSAATDQSQDVDSQQ